MTKQKIALISVFNKEGVDVFAKGLVELGWKIISSGGTAKFLTEKGIPNTDVAEITGMPAILSHRVVTLHPKIHGGLLAENTNEHIEELERNGIPWIDLVCVDLYPLEEEIKKHKFADGVCQLGHPMSSCTEAVIEKTDIGGPTMIRSGAKAGRIVVADPNDRQDVLNWLKNGEPEREKFISGLRAKAEEIISKYISLSAQYHGGGLYKNIFGTKTNELAYGENAYQKPSYLYDVLGKDQDPLAFSNWEQVAGSPMSYNNICDIDRMMQSITHIGAGFEKNLNEIPKIAIGVKHGNACGASFASSEVEALEKMLTGDLRAIFGGSVMVNFSIDEKLADVLIHSFVEGDGRRLLDVVCAPSFTREAVEILSRKKGKCRLLQNKNIQNAGISMLDNKNRFRYVRGGFLLQPNYTFVPDFAEAMIGKPELSRMPLDIGLPRGILGDLVLAWGIGCTSNSNTITLAKDGQLLGNGVGQQDRVGAAMLAIMRAGDKDLKNSVAYSDSFFPFPDAPQVLIDKGIKTIFATSGSVNDEIIKKLCADQGVGLLMVPDSMGRGFYQH